ncbi:MAG: type I DNA topoisomerase [Lachnospiraceae bacterium]|jgi:DNA topoisomerase-1|nr:type I DNA topoisomerase [Lachnospiraceae bacterium]MCH4030744.1 type I DNA topoisomerase [Lachnospiraceae bacterium]MCH4070716.1 type I DNA topoisomerase [Lachnospiraceae bacterium]MCH4107108.1 type I DNA topoisomerase [Lachnospiraceae bacterium]MCI1302036.1 type I DNA topoisomerase [Lachnospiraceae bacterium]
MQKNLVIVESPAKVKSIKKFLGKNYEVMASQGHIRDLPKSQLGIDVEHDFEPKYITIRGKGPLLASLKKAAKKADTVYLATDPDREGEAISWHLAAAMDLNDSNMKRITFNEITKKAVQASLKQPRAIDMNLVDAQQARRVLDRIVGYEISPILWKKIKRGLSAGRVQSVALRIICDRENEIAAFIPEEYWSLDASLQASGSRRPFTAKFYGDRKGKIELKSREDVEKVIQAVNGAEFAVESVKTSDRIRRAPLPFTTSTMQQEASRQLNFSTGRTMQIAQQLYEGVDIKGRGSIGLITYLRTDSTRVAQEAQTAAADYIGKNYGNEYVGHPVSAVKATGENHVQDAHEAIRPTDITLTPAMVKEELTPQQYKLYSLVWRRFTASQMSAAKFAATQVRISAGEYIFTVSGSQKLFDGFLSVYKDDADKDDKTSVPAGISTDTKLTLLSTDPEQHFTQPPAHYTEASLVHALEEKGIGRPSTYAPTISTILKRRYIVKEGKNLFVSELGDAVNKMMCEAFPEIVNVQFTANMESLLDGVEQGNVRWKTIIENFYPDLMASVNKAEKELAEVKIADEVSDVKCDVCGRPMLIKYGPHGKFLGCSGFPECRNTKPYFEKIGVKCPKCGKEVVIKRTRKGRIYYGCEDNPNCDFMSWNRPAGENCPRCGSYMVFRGKKKVCSNPDCGYVEEE